jgi:muramoyltetrapeptide carboxypeptidase
MAMPSLARAPGLLRLPPRLREGDTVGLVCPAGFIADRFGLEQVEETIRAMGLVPKAGKHLLDRYGYLAGQDRDRAADINRMFADPEVRAVFAVRGGWGSQRLLPHLDWKTIRANPKLLVGSSDVTALHLAIAARAGFATIHGPNAAYSWPNAAWEDFRALAFEAATPTYEIIAGSWGGLSVRDPRVRTFGKGKARGRLLGGNLSVLSALAGTPWLPDFTGAILFLEDTNEAEYRIDRMLAQIAQAGILKAVAGVVFGQCTNCRNPGNGYGNFTIYEVLEQHFAPLGVPAFQGAQIGHIAGQVPIPVGVAAEIDADRGAIRILAPAVA